MNSSSCIRSYDHLPVQHRTLIPDASDDCITVLHLGGVDFFVAQRRFCLSLRLRGALIVITVGSQTSCQRLGQPSYAKMVGMAVE